jgi:hypothetical protein
VLHVLKILSVASEVVGICSTETATLLILNCNTVEEIDGWLAASLSALNRVAVFTFTQLGAFEQLRIWFFRSCDVSCIFSRAVLAIHVREDNGIFATIQSTETNMFYGKILLGKISKC